jgi:predicted short-subunit dehydrogenase-like oxidoreductase (DUF2520 family)
MQKNSIRRIDLSMLVANVRTKRVQRVLERAQKQRERAHQRQRARALAKAQSLTQALVAKPSESEAR